MKLIFHIYIILLIYFHHKRGGLGEFKAHLKATKFQLSDLPNTYELFQLVT